MDICFILHEINLIFLCLSPRCSGVAACLGGTSSTSYPQAVRGLVEEGPDRQRKVWSHRFPHRSAEKLHFEETSQYTTSVTFFDGSVLGLFLWT